jgi:hypothetical protein
MRPSRCIIVADLDPPKQVALILRDRHHRPGSTQPSRRQVKRRPGCQGWQPGRERLRLAAPRATAAPRRSARRCLLLVATAGALYYFKGPVLLIATIVVFCKCWLWLCRRYPRTMWFVTIFLTALLGKRRR